MFIYLLTVPVPNKPPHLCGRKAECLLTAVIKLRDATLTYVTDVRAALMMTSRQQCLSAVKEKHCGKRISANVDQINYWLMIAYMPLFSALWADSLRSHAILHEWLAFYSAFLNIHRSGVLTALAWLVPHEIAAISAQVLCTPYNHAPCHFMQSQMRKVYACLAVTCHLHFWPNDRDLLRATAVTRGWNGYRNKSQHRKSTLEKKILPPLLQGFEPVTFQSRVRRSNHWAIPAPISR